MDNQMAGSDEDYGEEDMHNGEQDNMAEGMM